jgi:predicted amidophosphoribosyltransferase
MRKIYWIRRTHLFKKDEYECSFCRALSDEPFAVCPSCKSKMSRTKYDASWADEAAMWDEISGD